jgi:transcriptional regulator with XRE-family HTH domain
MCAMTHDTLKAWRAQRKWSKALAAREIGISAKAYAYYESGKWPIKRWLALSCAAIALGIQPHE